MFTMNLANSECIAGLLCAGGPVLLMTALVFCLATQVTQHGTGWPAENAQRYPDFLEVASRGGWSDDPEQYQHFVELTSDLDNNEE